MTTEKYDILTRISDLGIGQIKMLSDLDSDTKLLESYIKFAITDHKYAWRTAWVLSHYTKKNTNVAQKHADEFIKAAKRINANGHLREILKIIYNLNLSEEQTSEVFDICMDLLEDNKRQASVRMIAFNFLIRVAEDYPELNSEIEIIVENIKDFLSPGIKNSMTLRIKQVKKLTNKIE